MARALSEIGWDQPIVPVRTDQQWEREVKRKTGSVHDVLQRVSPSPWLRQLMLQLSMPRVVHITGHRASMMNMVTSQENACRYCYGANRATMRMLGYSEKRILQIERDVQLADFDEKDRAMLHFTRALARSKPRPGRADLAQLAAAGYSHNAIAEAAFFVAFTCLFNRVATFMAVPPVLGFERFANGLLGRLMRPLMASKLLIKTVSPVSDVPSGGRFRNIIGSLSGLPAAQLVHAALEGAFASKVLSDRLKLLMLGVVARSLQCQFCEAECRILQVDVFANSDEFEQCLNSLSDPHLTADEQRILTWTRNTVHYETEQIQRSTRELSAHVDAFKLVEAIGMASLANAIVRLAVVLE